MSILKVLEAKGAVICNPKTKPLIYFDPYSLISYAYNNSLFVIIIGY